MDIFIFDDASHKERIEEFNYIYLLDYNIHILREKELEICFGKILLLIYIIRCLMCIRDIRKIHQLVLTTFINSSIIILDKCKNVLQTDLWR